MMRVVAGEKIAKTLQTIRGLPHPVARSCHIGNNGNYNFAWLALAGNTRFIMYDHTAYGADRVCFPWMLVRDYGVVDTAFDHDGRPRPELQGEHVGSPQAEIPLRHRSILNYGIKAAVGNQPLFAYHFAANCELAGRFSDRVPTFDSAELLANFSLCEQMVRHFARNGELHELFDRWVTHRRGRVLMERIRDVSVAGGDIRITSTGGQLVFRGDVQALLDSLHEALRAIVAHITDAVAWPAVSYPWFNLVFCYLFGAATEFARDRTQTSFYHAGGLTSPYYMSETGFQQAFGRLAERLRLAGFLPRDFGFHVIPIACCQLYGSAGTVAQLEEIIGCARDALRRVASPEELDGVFQPAGPDLMARLSRRVESTILPKLVAETSRLNCESPNRLPVCLRSSPPATFTKYGVGGVHSRSLRQDDIIFPAVLPDLTWSEGEAIVLLLGQLFAHQAEGG